MPERVHGRLVEGLARPRDGSEGTHTDVPVATEGFRRDEVLEYLRDNVGDVETWVHASWRVAGYCSVKGTASAVDEERRVEQRATRDGDVPEVADVVSHAGWLCLGESRDEMKAEEWRYLARRRSVGTGAVSEGVCIEGDELIERL